MSRSLDFSHSLKFCVADLTFEVAVTYEGDFEKKRTSLQLCWLFWGFLSPSGAPAPCFFPLVAEFLGLFAFFRSCSVSGQVLTVSLLSYSSGAEVQVCALSPTLSLGLALYVFSLATCWGLLWLPRWEHTRGDGLGLGGVWLRCTQCWVWAFVCWGPVASGVPSGPWQASWWGPGRSW